MKDIFKITYERCLENYKNKSSNIAKSVLPQITDVFKNQSGTYKNIVIPFTDGIKTLQVTADLEESVETEGANHLKHWREVLLLHLLITNGKNI